MKFNQIASLSLTISIFSTNLEAQDKGLWSEKESSAQNLVNLPNLGPVIDLVDSTIANIATSSEPKKVERRRGQPQQGPLWRSFF